MSYLVIFFIIFICLVIIYAVYANANANSTIFGGGISSLQRTIAKKYSKFAAGPLKSFKEFCFPKSYAVQKQQAFVGEYMRSGSNNDALLIFHKIGAGKSCAAIQITNKWKKHGKPLMVMPASLIPGFCNELRTPCGNYISREDSAKLASLAANSREYQEIIQASQKRIDADYQIHSFNSFLNAPNELNAPIIVIDEVQNVVNMGGAFYAALLAWIDAHPKAPVVLMTGTPIFDNPREIKAMAKLMRIELPDDIEITPELIENKFAGKISYYAGAPKFTFPKKIIEVEKCQMSPFQAKWYSSEVAAEILKTGRIATFDMPNDFYIKSRQCANIVFPKGLKGDQGLEELTTPMILNNLANYSTKFAKLIPRLERGGLSFCYTAFTGAGGLAALTKCLKAFGWKDFAESGPGPKRYAIWSGDESKKNKDIIRATYNSEKNDSGGLIKTILGSPAIREGVSLFRVREVHIIESYWNHSRLEQIFGRADRYCSHKTLPEKERTVKIYIYAATMPKMNKVSPETSVDLYMLNMADKKQEISRPLIEAMKNCAIDRALHGYTRGRT